MSATIIERTYASHPGVLCSDPEAFAGQAKTIAACAVQHMRSCPHFNYTDYPGTDATRTRLAAPCVPHGCAVLYTVAEYTDEYSAKLQRDVELLQEYKGWR